MGARMELKIEKELVSRLHSDTYGDIYNFPTKDYLNALDMQDPLMLEESYAQSDTDEKDYQHKQEDNKEIELEAEPGNLKMDIEDFEGSHCNMVDSRKY